MGIKDDLESMTVGQRRVGRCEVADGEDVPYIDFHYLRVTGGFNVRGKDASGADPDNITCPNLICEYFVGRDELLDDPEIEGMVWV